MDKETSVKIRNEYIRKGMRICDLSRKYGVSHDSIWKLSKKEDWKEKRAEYQRKRTEKTMEKITEADSDRDAEISRLKDDIRLEIFRQIGTRLKRADLEEADFRRLTQSYKDMIDIEQAHAVNAGERMDDDPLSASLKALAARMEAEDDTGPIR